MLPCLFPIDFLLNLSPYSIKVRACCAELLIIVFHSFHRVFFHVVFFLYLGCMQRRIFIFSQLLVGRSVALLLLFVSIRGKTTCIFFGCTSGFCSTIMLDCARSLQQERH